MLLLCLKKNKKIQKNVLPLRQQVSLSGKLMHDAVAVTAKCTSVVEGANQNMCVLFVG
jgi:hypothetical protein